MALIKNHALPSIFGNTVTPAGPEAGMLTFKLTPLKKSTHNESLSYTHYNINTRIEKFEVIS